jgi:hypothetical protein
MIIKKIVVLFCFSLIGWALCGGVIALGRNVATMDITLIMHAVAVPIIFSILSWLYHKKYNYTSSVITGLVFLCFALIMDYFVVAMLIEKSYDMFKSVLGVWIPFALIFLSTLFVGLYVNSKKK